MRERHKYRIKNYNCLKYKAQTLKRRSFTKNVASTSAYTAHAQHYIIMTKYDYVIIYSLTPPLLSRNALKHCRRSLERGYGRQLRRLQPGVFVGSVLEQVEPGELQRRERRQDQEVGVSSTPSVTLS